MGRIRRQLKSGINGMRAIAFSFFAMAAMVLLACILFILSHVPANVRLFATMAFAESCTTPHHVPDNAGRLVVGDLRVLGDGNKFIDASLQTWVDETTAKIVSATDSKRDLVVYIHGFNTDIQNATCAGQVLRTDLASLPVYAAAGPDVFVFGWPSEFMPWQFAAGQGNATRAGPYLSGVLERLSGRRIILVAHSLGNLVMMVAVDRLPVENDSPLLQGMLLIQGAIPAVSIREWSETFKLTFPAAALNDLVHGRASKPPIEEETSGAGAFVNAAAKAAHLVVTTAGGDIPLSSLYVFKERLFPSDLMRPTIMPQPGDLAGNGPDLQAIGYPFPKRGIYRKFDNVLFDPLERFEDKGTKPRTHVWPDDSRVMSRAEWFYDFKVSHPSYHEINIDSGQWWRLLHDWHGAMNDTDTRQRILSEAWEVFTKQTH